MPTKKIYFILLVLFLLFVPWLTQAQTSAFIPSDCLSGGAEKCDLVDLVQMFANFYLFLVKYVGAFALLLFVIGGVFFITAGGNQERITRGRHILVGTLIGLFIVMTSYIIVLQIQKLIGVSGEYQLQSSQNNQTECVGKVDGVSCRGPAGNVYVCINQICQNGQGAGTVTFCVYNRGGECLDNCNTTNCQNGTCQPGFCDGGDTRLCCVPNP